jgi:DNA polymerase, archaea type
VKHEGWILDLYHRPDHMVIWLKTPEGRCVKLTDKWTPKMHVAGEYRSLVDLACKPYIQNPHFVKKIERPGDGDRSQVLEIDVESEGDAERVSARIEREGHYTQFRLYDVDVPSPQVYLYQKGLFPLAFVEADYTGSQVKWTLKDSRDSIDYALPPLQKVRLSIQTRKTKRIPTFGDQLDSAQVCLDSEQTITIDSGSEAEKILDLVDLFRKIDPDIVITGGGDSFLFPYLAKRAHENGMLDRLILGRDHSPLRVYEVQGHSYFSYGKILYKDTAARLLGRLHIDDHNAYITVDCGLEGLFEISRTCIMPIQRASRATIGTNMSSLQIYHAIKEDILIPWSKNQAEDWKDSEELGVADRGGFIHDPDIGIYDQVGEIDFTSLYPTIMRDRNLSGETVNCKCCPGSTLRVPELDYYICVRRKGIVSQSLTILLDRRLKFKQLKKETRHEEARKIYDERQSALKWILVCSFGYLGFKNARFGKIDAHIATCAFSRVVLDRAIAIAQNHGFRKVHAIVDSMWLTKPSATAADYDELCRELSGELGFPVSFEGQYRWIVFLNSKTVVHSSVLNRYYGFLQNGTLRVRGIDLRRHDTPTIVRNCQSDMFTVFERAHNAQEFRGLIPEALQVLGNYVSELRRGSVAIEDLVITRSMSKNPGEYTNRIPQSVSAERIRREGGSIQAGQQVRYILTLDKSKKPEEQALPPELVDDSTVYDSEKYVDLLISSAANMLLPFGYSRKSLTKILN